MRKTCRKKCKKRLTRRQKGGTEFEKLISVFPTYIKTEYGKRFSNYTPDNKAKFIKFIKEILEIYPSLTETEQGHFWSASLAEKNNIIKQQNNLLKSQRKTEGIETLMRQVNSMHGHKFTVTTPYGVIQFNNKDALIDFIQISSDIEKTIEIARVSSPPPPETKYIESMHVDKMPADFKARLDTMIETVNRSDNFNMNDYIEIMYELHEKYIDNKALLDAFLEYHRCKSSDKSSLPCSRQKIMLINGAVPDQSYLFNIPEGYVALYYDHSIDLQHYRDTRARKSALKNSINHAFSLIDYPRISDVSILNDMCDLVIFDVGVIKDNPLTKDKILHYMDFMRDRNSVLVLDNIQGVPKKFIMNSENKSILSQYGENSLAEKIDDKGVRVPATAADIQTSLCKELYMFDLELTCIRRPAPITMKELLAQVNTLTVYIAPTNIFHRMSSDTQYMYFTGKTI